MAKKSKIAVNERRKAVVERYAARQAELKEIIRTGSPQSGRTPYGNCPISRATPAPPGSATATPSTDAFVGTDPLHRHRSTGRPHSHSHGEPVRRHLGEPFPSAIHLAACGRAAAFLGRGSTGCRRPGEHRHTRLALGRRRGTRRRRRCGADSRPPQPPSQRGLTSRIEHRADTGVSLTST
jgi:hypothetical protein